MTPVVLIIINAVHTIVLFWRLPHLAILAFVTLRTKWARISNGLLHLTPSIDQTERSMYDSFAVACHGPRGTNATWWSPENKVITAETGRVHVEKKEDKSSGPYVSLVFEKIERNDKGNYTCVTVVNGTREDVSFKLIVVKPISFVGTIAVQNVTEFKSETLRCEVTGDPEPSIIWQFRGKELPRIGERYRILPRGIYITNITRQDAGVYLCRAFQVTTQTSTVKDRLIQLHVHHKPTWRTPLVHGDMEDGKVYGYKNGVANLTCEVDAEPEAEFTWTRNNQTIDPSLRIINDPNKSVLQVPMVNNTILGKYECQAVNAIGKMWKQFDLREGSRPPKPSSISVGSVGATSVVLHIHRASHDTIGYRVEFVKRYPDYNFSNPDYQDVFSSPKFPYTLVNLTENTDYVFRVASRNRAGISDFSETYSFKTRIRSTSAAVQLQNNMYLLATVSMVLGTIFERTIFNVNM